MKRFVLHLFAFLSIALVGYILLLAIFIKYVPGSWRTNMWYVFAENGHTYTKLREADTVKNTDILVLGTSHAYMGYDPRIFEKEGYKLFNLGTPLQSMSTTKYLCEKYLDKIKPRFIILDVYPPAFNGKIFESAVDIISNDKLDGKLIKFALAMQNAKLYNTLLYASVKSLTVRDNFKEPITQGHQRYIMRGYEETYHTYKGDSTYRQYALKVDAQQLQSFNDIVHMIAARHIPLIIVQAPVLPKKYEACLNNDYFDRLLSLYGRYINFNKSIQMPDNFMEDYGHLNQRGVCNYNDIVIDSLKHNSAFIDTFKTKK